MSPLKAQSVRHVLSITAFICAEYVVNRGAAIIPQVKLHAEGFTRVHRYPAHAGSGSGSGMLFAEEPSGPHLQSIKHMQACYTWSRMLAFMSFLKPLSPSGPVTLQSCPNLAGLRDAFVIFHVVHRGLVVLGMQLPGSFQRHGSPVRRELTGVQAHHQDENDLRIQDMEASLTVMLQEIQPVWWHLKGIKVGIRAPAISYMQHDMHALVSALSVLLPLLLLKLTRLALHHTCSVLVCSTQYHRRCCSDATGSSAHIFPSPPSPPLRRQG